MYLCPICLSGFFIGLIDKIHNFAPMLSKRVKLASFCVLALLATGCSEYAKILRNEDANAKLEYAKKAFEQEKYSKVVKVLEPVYSQFKSTKEGENTDWMMAYSWYMDESYELAAYMMSNYARMYPMSDKAEEAAFLSAQSSYKISPESYLDQENTTKAVAALQRFLDRYPNAPQAARADSMIRELNTKLDKKQFDIAYNYYRLEDYHAAVIAFSNILDDNPATSYREKIMYYRLRAAAIYANKSIPELQQERYIDALTYGRIFLQRFPDSPYAPEVQNLVKVIEERSSALDEVIKSLNKDLGKVKTKNLNKKVEKEVKTTKKQEKQKEK